jgi:hypothetical protein
MPFLYLFHNFMVTMFAALNGVMLYLFMLHLPFGGEAFFLSLKHWDRIQSTPPIGVVATLSVGLSVIAVILVKGLNEEWKNRLLFMRWVYPHPASDAFLTSRRQPFQSKELLEAFPRVKDGGFSRTVQTGTWIDLYGRFKEKRVVLNTDLHWRMLRDLYMVSLLFIGPFLLVWALNHAMPFSIVATYAFLFGTQFLFLLLASRRVGYKLVDNVLAVALGMEEYKKPGRKG